MPVFLPVVYQMCWVTPGVLMVESTEGVGLMPERFSAVLVLRQTFCAAFLVLTYWPASSCMNLCKAASANCVNACSPVRLCSCSRKWLLIFFRKAQACFLVFAQLHMYSTACVVHSRRTFTTDMD